MGDADMPEKRTVRKAKPAETALPASSTPCDVARTAHKLIAAVKGDIISLLQKLVQTDSVAIPPDGNEAPAQKILLKTLKTYGLDAKLYDTAFLAKSKNPYVRHERNYKGRPNLVACLPGKGRGKSLLFSGHIDTVPPGKNPWRGSPWSGAIRGGKLYGRGAWDMKGGLAAQFGVLMALKRAGVRLGGDLLAESVVDEEWAGAGGTLAARLKGIKADACVITEGTNLSVVRATRGGFFLEIISRAGDASAYFSKEEVLSPAVPMGRLLGWIDMWTKKRRAIDRGQTYKDFPDPAPVQVLALEAHRFDPDTPWATPLEAKLRVYFQFLPYENVPGVIRAIRHSLNDFCRKDPFFRKHPPEWRPIVDPPLLGHELPANHPWTRCLADAASCILGERASVSAAEYPCDAFLIQREFGIPTLLFGPCGAGAHNVDEYVTLKSVVQTAEALLAAALTWCGT
jgi:acetylornithine deacetylase